jgi:spore maturation protein SpmB
MPAEVLPVALLRPLSGTGAFGVMASVVQDVGPDTYMGYLASTLTGSTDTTFYILAVYFGAVQVRRTRHAIATGLTADVAGAIGAVIAVSYLYGG